MLTEEKRAEEKAVSPEVSTELSERMSGARRQSDTIFSLVRPGSLYTSPLYERPIPERHRIIFYVGHLEAFDWNLLSAVFGLKSAHAEFDHLFAFGIDPVGGGLPADVPSDWPSVDIVREYVRNVRSEIDRNRTKISAGPSPTRDGFPLRTLLNVAIEHRLMHAETLAYMLHQLPVNMKVTEAGAPILTGPPVNHHNVAIPSGRVRLGLDRNSDAFGWDNEYEAHTAEVPGFEIDRYKVTNRQYLDFIAAGGYETRAFWSGDDWDWKTARGISHPLFWKRAAGGWLWRAMFDEVPLPLDWPVYVSHAEASAYARWAGKSLPTEAEWQSRSLRRHR